MKKKLLKIVALFIGSLVVLILVISFSSLRRSKQGFNRHFLYSKFTLIRSIRLKHPQFYFSGSGSTNLYLGNYLFSNLLFSASLDLADTFYRHIPPPDLHPLAWGMLTTQVDSPQVYLIDGLTPSLIRTDLSFGNPKREKIAVGNFTAGLILSPDLALFKNFDRGLSQDILSTQGTSGLNYLRDSFILEKQQDGRFSVDGMLLQAADRDRIFFIYYYRNRFLCLDSNLHLLYAAKTIDTNAYAKLKIGRIESEKKTLLVEPPLMVNKMACADNQFFYVYSGLPADNEKWSLFSRLASLDLYAIRNGRYCGSIRVPLSAGHKIRGVRIIHQLLYILEEEELKCYSLRMDPNL